MPKKNVKQTNPSEESTRHALEFVTQSFEAAKQARYRLEQEWKIDYQYYIGRQDIRWSEKLNQFFVVTPKNRRPDDLITNKIWTYTINNASDLGVEVPSLQVLPATNEPQDRQNAHILRKVFESLWHEYDLGQHVMDCCYLASIYGTSFLKILWDPDTGRGGMDESRGKRVTEGGFDFSVLSPWELFVDPRATSIRDARYVIHAKPVHVREVFERYGELVEPDNDVSASSEEEMLVVSELDVTAGDDLKDPVAKRASTDDVADGYVLVKECWTKDRVTTIANGVLLRDEENEMGMLPIVPFYDYYEPKKFWGIGEGRRVRDLQKRYNKLNTQIVRNIELMGNPKLLADVTTTFKTPITNDFGTILRFEGPPPQIQPGIGVPGEMFAAADRVGKLLDEVSNQITIDPVSLTKSNISGRFVEAYRDVASKPLKYKKLKIEDSLRQVGRYLLRMMQLKFTKGRVFRTIGANKDVQFWSIGKDTIKSGVDVYFTVRSQLPESKVGKMDFYLQMVQAGILRPDEVRKLLGLEGVISEVESDAIGLDRDPETVIRQADQENEMVAQGQSPEILPMRREDVEAHLQSHYAFLNGYLKPNTREEKLMLDLIRKEDKMRGNVQPYQPPVQGNRVPNPLGTGGPIPGQPPFPQAPTPVGPQTAEGIPAEQPNPFANFGL